MWRPNLVFQELSAQRQTETRVITAGVTATPEVLPGCAECACGCAVHAHMLSGLCCSCRGALPRPPVPHLPITAHLVGLRPSADGETGPERLRTWMGTELVSGGSGFEPDSLTPRPTYLTKMLPVSPSAWLGMGSSLRMTQCTRNEPCLRKIVHL